MLIIKYSSPYFFLPPGTGALTQPALLKTPLTAGFSIYIIALPVIGANLIQICFSLFGTKHKTEIKY